ncbi:MULTISPECIES: SpdD-like protein [unclassified Streptomyces]|uniref:SpdD-like protein n=1 Tax=unclassified Streptomyces TaxID=2593676 RepID=UPI0016601698|nr:MULTISPECIES: SpdD-like protein [unclassified Streptomyces]MBD0712404.1 SpdD-like protein [Streptomyces sp. CBMA291]MBD0716778.1 SpdD-like protein [Streptomyces sp. CBMA370]
MFQPRIPVNPLPTSVVVPLVRTTPTGDIEPHATAHPPVCDHHHAPATAPVPARSSAVHLTPAGLAVVVAGGAGAVLVVGAVLVSMLLAVAVSAASVAVCAVVLRSLLNGRRRHR